MIAHVSGRVAALAPDAAVVEVGGLGVLLQCTPGTLAGLRVGQQATLATSLVVREDSLTLYGFVDDDERATFELLQTASGVGPRVAQAVLGVLRPRAVRAAIATEDLTALTRVPGIGRKGAQRIVLELKDRIGAVEPGDGLPALPPGAADRLSGPGGAAAWRYQLHSALTGLGWSGREADEAVEALVSQVAAAEQPPDLAVLLRDALRLLGPA